MSETLIIPESNNKKEIYEAIIPQIKSLVETESDTIANLANITAVLKEAFNFFWVGFYISQNDQLILAPFQGPLACTRIRKGKGVCGTAFAKGETIVVEDVEKFEGHIACSSLSKSEIVVPIIKNNQVWGVLDIDSKEIASFNETDKHYLEIIAQLITNLVIKELS